MANTFQATVWCLHVRKLLPFELSLTLVKDISVPPSVRPAAVVGNLEGTYSLPSTLRMPSFNVHFHLFLTRATLSYVQNIT